MRIFKAKNTAASDKTEPQNTEGGLSDSEIERLTFEFDLQGFVIIRNFLNESTVDELNGIIDSHPEKKVKNNTGKFTFVTLNDIFLDILSHDKIVVLCRNWIHEQFRFDHAWGYQDCSRSPVQELHAGPYRSNGYFQYHWDPRENKPSCSCVNFGLSLLPQRANDGGICIVPGSHKSNMLDSGYINKHYLKNSESNHNLAASWIVQPVLEKGDLLVFAEATMHGTSTWLPNDRSRRILYFKYGYGFSSWLPHDNPELIALRHKANTERQRRLLSPPCVSESAGTQDQPGNKGLEFRKKII